MTASEFTAALHRGLGRGVLFARSRDVSEFRDIILDACLHCYAIDPIFEGTRGGYMLDVIETLPDRSFYCKRVIEMLPHDQESWHGAQRFFIAQCLASAGDMGARLALYNSFDPGPRFGETLGINFVNMDGADGLAFVARKLGACIRTTRSSFDIGHLLWVAKERLGEVETWSVLRSEANRNADAAAFVKACEEPRKPRSNGTKAAQPQAPEPDPGTLLAHYVEETDPAKLHEMEDDLRNSSLGLADRTRVLLTIYEKTYCSFNRQLVVNALIGLGALPLRLREECAWDADPETRELVQATLT